MDQPIKIPVLLGPTASGKSALALKLAATLGYEIISCDSRQLYQYMNIGTAKPSIKERDEVRHWMIDCITPDVRFSAWNYAKEVTALIRKRHAAGHKVLICGGTGLYFKALSQGMGPQAAANGALREKLYQSADLKGKEWIFNELKLVDPQTAANSHPNNVARNIRALEVYLQTGTSLSTQKENTVAPEEFEFVVFVLDMPRNQLYERINRRVDNMIAKGLWDEFLALRAKGYSAESPGMRSVGYQELFMVEKGECSIGSAAEKIQQHSRHYAKRQITWFRHQLNGIWIDANNGPCAAISNRID